MLEAAAAVVAVSEVEEPDGAAAPAGRAREELSRLDGADIDGREAVRRPSGGRRGRERRCRRVERKVLGLLAQRTLGGGQRDQAVDGRAHGLLGHGELSNHRTALATAGVGVVFTEPLDRWTYYRGFLPRKELLLQEKFLLDDAP